MSENTGIQWTDHTFNPWWGCTKVHSGCANCYAELWDARWGGNHWGNNPRRMVLGEWSKPAKWSRDAEKAGVRARVFCASMCDLFEDFNGPVVDQQDKPVPMRDQVGNWTVPLLRNRGFRIIEETPNLEWQLLTKRPENVTRMVPPAWLTRWPTNVIVGTSPCDQKTADESIPHLLKIPGRRFLSCEPLLGTVNLTFALYGNKPGRNPPTVDWVIVGCESDGARANLFSDGYADSARSIIHQCGEAGVPVFHKQMPIDGMKSGDQNQWPEWARVREFPEELKHG